MIKLETVNESNWRDVINIEVANTQRGFIESNRQSLLEAAYDTSLKWHPFVASKDQECVGFTMIGAYDATEHYIWLDRVMLSEDYQGKGLGTEMLDAVVQLIKEKWVVKEIILSVTPDNKQAIAFYANYGFEWLDKTDPANGEQLMRLAV